MKELKSLCKDKTTLLVDGDLYVYQACVIAEQEIDWGNDIWTIQTDLKQAKDIIKGRFKDFCETLSTKEMLVCFSEGQNFRKSVHPHYKAGRKKTRKPLGYNAACDWVRDNYPTHSQDTLEADDVMGIIQTCGKYKTAIVSDDKDLKTIPGKLYRPISQELFDINDNEANYNFYTQCLVGDAVDGYRGCDGIGVKTAAKILGNHPSWNQVLQTYQKANLSRAYAIEMSRCARILRSSDWNWETQTINLWSPSC
jgi:DNA polymerase-1